MIAASGLPADLKPFPFVVQLLPGTVAADFPKPQEPKADLANNHLGYAITWFGLALTLLGVPAFISASWPRRGRACRRRAGDPDPDEKIHRLMARPPAG